MTHSRMISASRQEILAHVKRLPTRSLHSLAAREETALYQAAIANAASWVLVGDERAVLLAVGAAAVELSRRMRPAPLPFRCLECGSVFAECRCDLRAAA